MLLTVLIGFTLLSLTLNVNLLLRFRQVAKRSTAEALLRAKAVLCERGNSSGESDAFLATLSHELRTPLTSVRAAIRLLSIDWASTADQRTSRLLGIAASNTERLIRMVNDILDIERVKGGDTLSLQACVVEDLLLQAVSEMSSLADEVGITIKVDCDWSTKGQVINCNADRVLQVQCNLLSNALKFSPPASTILVNARVEAQHLVLCVEDAGRGVPTEMLDTIFEPFKQVEETDSKKKGGAGLGLAICRVIVNQHGGVIYARRNDEDKAGKPGLAMFVHLPLASPLLCIPSALRPEVHSRHH